MTEAQRLAATLESDANDHRAIAQSVDGKPEHTTNWQHMLTAEEAAAELRRLDEELTICAQLKRGYRDLYAQAMTECEQLRADAARYQWLRSSKFIWSDFAYIRGFDKKVVGIEFQWFETDAKKPNKEDLDAAIDAAMKETK